jgi:glucose/arabinose dehydrogenase
LPYTVEKTFAKLTWKSPIYIADEPGTDRLWVVQEGGGADQGARIVRIEDDPAAGESEVVLDMPKRLVYSVCFHPDYASNGFVYVFSNGPRDAPERRNRITRFTVGRQRPWRVDPESEQVVIEWKSAGHDGGDMTFGRDGLFYVTTGDGTSDSDAWDSGQTLDDLLGSVLRIDVDRRDGDAPYGIPPDNPFVATPGARPEIWAYGLRNPWRMGSDPQTGQIWVGNNGQDLWETAHLVRRGENYGWSVYEGSHPFYLERRRGPTPHVPPTIEHPHAEFRSLTGGVVYRGGRLPDLDGAYIYGDYSSGRIWGMKHDGRRALWHRELADTSLQIAAFRVDHRGDLLIADHGGGIYRLVPRPAGEPTAPFPTLLSRTGLFSSTEGHRADRALIPYSVNAPGWADGALAERFLAIPGALKVGFDQGRGWSFPDGTALVQTLSLGRGPGDDAARSRVETRILLRQQGEWEGYSYRWNAAQSDATLVPKEGEDAEIAPEPPGPGPASGGASRVAPSAWPATAARRISSSA